MKTSVYASIMENALLSISLKNLDVLYRHVTLFTIWTAIDLEPYTNLSTVFRVPAHRQEAQVFSSKGIVKHIPLHLVIVPVSRQCLRERKEYLLIYMYNI